MWKGACVTRIGLTAGCFGRGADAGRELQHLELAGTFQTKWGVAKGLAWARSLARVHFAANHGEFVNAQCSLISTSKMGDYFMP